MNRRYNYARLAPSVPFCIEKYGPSQYDQGDEETEEQVTGTNTLPPSADIMALSKQKTTTISQPLLEIPEPPEVQDNVTADKLGSKGKGGCTSCGSR